MADLRTERIRVQGCRSAQAPATVGQRSIWTDIEYMMPDTSFYNSVLPVEVAPGIDLERVYEALRVLIERHGALRSYFHRDPEGGLVQRMAAGGEVVVELCLVDSGQDTDPRGLVADLERSIKGHRFDHAAEWPLRVGVGVLDGAPRVVLLALSHIAGDFPSLRILARELGALVRGESLGPAPLQPVDLADWERSAEGLRVRERALRHWERELRAMPPQLLAEVEGPPEQPRFPKVWLRSEAVALAVDALSARYRISGSMVILAATALVLGRAAGVPRVTMVLIAGNRTRPMLRDYVGNLAQDVPVGIDLTGPDFGAVTRGAWSAAMNAYRNGYCDRAETTRLREEVAAERGTDLELAYYVNDLRPVGGAVPEAPSTDRVRDAVPRTNTGALPGVERDNLQVFLDILAPPGTSELEFTLRADSLRLPSAEMTLFLRRVEALLVAAVEYGDVHGTARLMEIAEAEVTETAQSV